MEMLELAVGIDIGGTNTMLGLVDNCGEIHGEAAVETRDFPDFDLFAAELGKRINALLGSVGTHCKLTGIGIGAPNANHIDGTIEYAPGLPWPGVVPVTEYLSRYFPGMPVAITNDANVAAMGEMMFGAARGMRDFIVISLGTRLGCGVVSNGQVVCGHDSFGGELGHVIVNHGGRACSCGRRGCLETYASASGIKRTVFKLLTERMEESAFRKIPFDDLSAGMVTRAALDGDPLAINAFEYTGMMLGQTLANVVAVTGPEAIILCGELAKAGKYIFKPTKKYMEMHMMPSFRNKVRLLPSALGNRNTVLLGAATLIRG